jgi:zinc transporter
MSLPSSSDHRRPAPEPPIIAEIIPGLVWGFHIGEDSLATRISDPAELADRRDGWFWLHFNLADMRARHWLAAATILPRAGTELLLSTDDAQQLVTSENCVRGIFFDLVRDIDRVHDDFGYFRFVMTERFLVSGRRRALNAAEAVRQDVEHRTRFTSGAELLAAIIERIADGIDHVVEELATEIDAIEDAVLKDRSADERQRLGSVRLTTVRIHRRLNGLRALFRRLAGDHADGPMSAIRTFVGRLLQRLDEIDHQVIELRDRAHLLQEEITLKLAEETNRHLHVLSILTAVLLPPTLITGLFGMNVEGLPFAGRAHGFIGAVVLSVAVSLLAVWVLYLTGVLRRQQGEPPPIGKRSRVDRPQVD